MVRVIIGLLVAFILLGVSKCNGPEYLTVYLVVTGPSEQVFNISEDVPGGKLFQAKLSECDNCEHIDIQLPSRETISVSAEPMPILSLSREEIQEIQLAEIRSPFAPEVVDWIASAMPTPEAFELTQAIAQEFPFDRVLIKLKGRPVDVHPIATWSSGLQIGVFDKREKLTNFVRGLDLPVTWIPFDEQGFEEIRKRAEHFLESDVSENSSHGSH